MEARDHAVEKRTRAPVSLEQSLSPLRDRFNEDRERMRAVAILSPTCTGCIHAADQIAPLLQEFSGIDLSWNVVWIPMLPADSESTAMQAGRSLSDRRVRQFYDPARRLAIAYASEVFPRWASVAFGALSRDHVLYPALEQAAGRRAEECPLWDAAFFYDRAAAWTSAVPRPVLFSKQYTFREAAGEGGATGIFTRDDFAAPVLDSDWRVELRRHIGRLCDAAHPGGPS